MKQILNDVGVFLNGRRWRDSFAVAIKTEDGQLYICHKDLLIIDGKTIAKRQWLESDDQVSERIMARVAPYAKSDEYEVVHPTALGGNHNYFIVWFAPSDFDPTAPDWHGFLLSVDEKSAFTRNQQRAISYIVERAERRHKGKRLETTASIAYA